ncbi:MAG: hypothetical protein BIP78_1256 [Candidatus Bipolaricaulis sibiricus]|uniref:Cell division protein FtsX n=1 Tax=Bipolaricaulis sibiricus TaxID=2501609 RepID=A0A410FVM0_BIPS1|nr:MAG: hypothetical protein BIP78_1256 [Candidatus Bipolaricaulis sibiricus]
MSYGIGFLTVDVLRRTVARPLALIVWALAVVAVLVSGTALFLIPIAPVISGATTEAYLLAQLAVDPSEAAIARLGSEVWTWQGVDVVTFRFPGENDPVAITQRTLVVRLLAPDARSTVESRLRALTEVVGVQYHERRSGHTSVPAASRVVALVVLVGALALSLWLGYRAVTGAAAAWGRELALLHSCGVSPAARRAPFLALGAAVGLVAGGLYVAICWALWMWGGSTPYLRDVVPSFPYVWGGLTAAGMAIGVGLGLVGSLIATVAPPTYS